MYEGKEGVKLVWLEKICYKVLFTAAILIFNHCISFFVSFEQLFAVKACPLSNGTLDISVICSIPSSLECCSCMGYFIVHLNVSL